MNIRELLVEPIAFMPPARLLEGLGEDDTERRLTDKTHSIAEIVAHMAFWQDWFCRRCEGRPAAMVGAATEGWPEVARGSWPEVRTRFAAGLKRALALGTDDAHHNAHHLGQIIVLRQVMGLWPPPSGRWTW